MFPSAKIAGDEALTAIEGLDMDLLEKEIGEAAGKVWSSLRAKGPMAKTRIPKETGISAQLANQAVGWLAREGKLVIQKDKKVDLIGLKE